MENTAYFFLNNFFIQVFVEYVIRKQIKRTTRTTKDILDKKHNKSKIVVINSKKKVVTW